MKLQIKTSGKGTIRISKNKSVSATGFNSFECELNDSMENTKTTAEFDILRDLSNENKEAGNFCKEIILETIGNELFTEEKARHAIKDALKFKNHLHNNGFKKGHIHSNCTIITEDGKEHKAKKCYANY